MNISEAGQARVQCNAYAVQSAQPPVFKGRCCWPAHRPVSHCFHSYCC